MKILSRSFEPPVVVLTIGVAARCLIFVFLSPYNNDAHITIVEFLVKYKAFPSIADNYLAFHPPLYYLLAAPILALSGSDKAVQSLSLVCSIGTLILLYKIIYRTGMIVGEKAKLFSLLIASFLPQFIMFSLYVSNDSLSFLLGVWMVWASATYLDKPNWRNCALVALLTGLGLLTKTSFLAFVPVLLFFILFVQFREDRSFARAVRVTSVFALIALGLGCYKYVDNYVKYRNPLISSLDVNVWSFQERSFHGIHSYLDFNLLHLVASPSIPFDEVMGESAKVGITGSYPLLLYGTLWYQLIPESNFKGASHQPYFYLGSLIYLIAVIPTAAFMIGAARSIKDLPSFVRSFVRAKVNDQGKMVAYLSGVLLASNAALLVAALIKYHVWSVMQGRYLFPCFPGILAMFACGMERFESTKYGAVAMKSSMVLLVSAFGVYFSSEIGYLILHWLHPGIRNLVGIALLTDWLA